MPSGLQLIPENSGKLEKYISSQLTVIRGRQRETDTGEIQKDSERERPETSYGSVTWLLSDCVPSDYCRLYETTWSTIYNCRELRSIAIAVWTVVVTSTSLLPASLIHLSDFQRFYRDLHLPSKGLNLWVNCWLRAQLLRLWDYPLVVRTHSVKYLYTVIDCCLSFYKSS